MSLEAIQKVTQAEQAARDQKLRALGLRHNAFGFVRRTGLFIAGSLLGAGDLLDGL